MQSGWPCVLVWGVAVLGVGSPACHRTTALVSKPCPCDAGVERPGDVDAATSEAGTTGFGDAWPTLRDAGADVGDVGDAPARDTSIRPDVRSAETVRLAADALGCNGRFSLVGLLPPLPTGNANQISAGDLNGDGKTDLVIQNYSQEVTVWLGQGDGRFTAQGQFPSAGDQQTVSLADVNGDGKLDLAISSGIPGKLSVRLGRGDGTFGVAVDSPSGGSRLEPRFGDLDGDGKLDVVTASSDSTASVIVLLGRGDGSFGAPVAIVAGDLVRDMAVGDFDGDGRLDIVVVSHDSVALGYPSTGTVNIRYGKGDGTFGDNKQTLTCAGLKRPDLMATGDFNGDGAMDIAVTGAVSGDGALCVWLSGKGGTFSQPVMTSTHRSYYPTPSFVAADVDGDGKLDIIDTQTILLGRGDASFAQGPSLPAAYLASAIAIADMNGDGRLDVALAFDDVSVLLQSPDGTFGPVLPRHPVGEGAASVALGDLNGDGKLDAVTANGESLSVLLGKGGDSFGGHVDYPLAGVPTVLLLGDVNRDGSLDIVTDLPGGVLLGQADGTFVAVADAAGIGGTAMALGDLNGDGALDAVTVFYAHPTGRKGNVRVRLGAGDGTFADPVEYGVGVDPRWVTLGDVDGNGTLDLVVANEGADGPASVSVLLGKGDGTFDANRDYVSGWGQRWTALGDLNGDGALDIFTMSTVDVPEVFLGNGDGTFALGPTFDGVLPGGFTVLGDVDGDGRLDVVSSGNSTVEVRFGRGDGSIGQPVSYTASVAGFALGDLNGDGLLDVVATEAGGDSVLAMLTSCR